jgi:hypothetical protein
MPGSDSGEAMRTAAMALQQMAYLDASNRGAFRIPYFQMDRRPLRWMHPSGAAWRSGNPYAAGL